MAYNPNLYNPYGLQQPQPSQMFQPQPVNGLSFIEDEKVLDTLHMPPGSVSQPYFLKNENKFIIVTFDNIGGSTKETFSFVKDETQNLTDTVTKADLEAFKAEMMEAINGKYAISETTTETELSTTTTQPDPATGTV